MGAFVNTKVYIENKNIRDWLSEALSMFMYMSLLLGSAATGHFSGREDDALFGVIFQGFSITFGIYIGGAMSGAIINPALTLAVALLGKISWRKCIVLQSAQYIGSFIASAVVYLIYNDSLDAFGAGANFTATEPGVFRKDVAGIWSTFPKTYLKERGAIFNQIFCSMLLTFGFLAISDYKNFRPSKGLFPIAVGLLVMTVFLAFSYSTGAAMNPARDFSPRLWSLIIGYGIEVFSYNQYEWFWIPWLMPYVGAMLGALIYQLLIGAQWSKGQKGESKHKDP
uniref:Aquaporin-9 n=1 Tax=Milnesium tardigradum TaxID=46460 RepID=AQP9_MILTA|nr:RecName: Full=Aquaporin-9; Short=AQP-9 [Milnesium tardigradum]AEP14563.1 aquaporin 9 [Milnesium tardigradum]